MVDWGFAVRTGVTGILLVFAILSVLALTVWVTGLILRNRSAKPSDLKDKKV